MLFAIDAGNQYITIGGLDDTGETLFRCLISTDKARTGDEYAVLFKNILDIRQISGRTVTGAIISSVVPSLTGVLRQAALMIAGRPPLMVGPGTKTGLNILMENPGQMGGDIVSAAVAALNRYPLPCVTVDFGTATTIGVLDAKGNYIGGVICPGVVVSLEGMNRTTSQLPGISLEAPGSVIGRETVECMQSGIVYGFAAMFEGMMARIAEQLGETPTVVVTGESAELILPQCRMEGAILDENLALRGLWIIYQRNARKK